MGLDSVGQLLSGNLQREIRLRRPIPSLSVATSCSTDPATSRTPSEALYRPAKRMREETSRPVGRRRPGNGCVAHRTAPGGPASHPSATLQAHSRIGMDTTVASSRGVSIASTTGTTKCGGTKHRPSGRPRRSSRARLGNTRNGCRTRSTQRGTGRGSGRLGEGRGGSMADLVLRLLGGRAGRRPGEAPARRLRRPPSSGPPSRLGGCKVVNHQVGLKCRQSGRSNTLSPASVCHDG